MGGIQSKCVTPALAAPSSTPVFNLQIVAQTAGNPYDGQFIGFDVDKNVVAVSSEASATSLFVDACGELVDLSTFYGAEAYLQPVFGGLEDVVFNQLRTNGFDPALTCSVSSSDSTLSCDGLDLGEEFYLCSGELKVNAPITQEGQETVEDGDIIQTLSSTTGCLPVSLQATQIGTYCGGCTDACASRPAQPLGSGPLTSPDTASAFLANPTYASIASAARTPSGYLQTFVNLNAENNAVGYMGYDLLESYDTEQCAANCDAKTGCRGINIAFERDPTVDPGDGCTDPASTVMIKCVYWGNPVTADTATNSGQYRADFQVVVAGSNGYIQAAMPELPGYAAPEYYNNASINAPLDCQGTDTYMGFESFTDGQPFDPSRCAAACAAENAWRASHPPPAGQPTVCAYFNTYWLLHNNGISEQRCVKYSEHWPASYAVNDGYTSGSDEYTILASVGYTNATSDGVPSQCSDADPAQTSEVVCQKKRSPFRGENCPQQQK